MNLPNLFAERIKVIEIPNPLADAHVHFGTCGLTGLVFFEADVVNLVRRFGLDIVLVCPFDLDLHRTNLRVFELAKHTKEVKVLLRMSALSPFNDLLDLIQDEHVAGVKFHPSMDKTPITNEHYTSSFKVLDDLGKCALIHCGRWEQVASYRFAIERAQQHPHVKVIIAHMGGNELANTKGAIEDSRSQENIFLDTSNCRISRMIEYAVELLGDDRILFGSDTPWGNIPANAAMILEAEVSSITKRKIMHDNLVKLVSR